MSQYQTINEFKVGDRIYGHFLVSRSEAKANTTKKGEYLDMVLVDQTGECNAKVWDCTDYHKDRCASMKIVYATGVVTDYNGNVYLKVEHVDTAPPTMKVTDFVPTAPFDSEFMLNMVRSYLPRIHPQPLRDVTEWVLNYAEPKLLSYPAAKGMHHNVYGGLLFHITTMLRVADQLSEVYSHLNYGLLFAAIIWHDIEKLSEMDATYGMVSDYTPAGVMLGHITQGILLADKAFRACEIEDDELKMVLQHMILSHHDRPDWGSPVAPMLPEAVMLHMIDNIDAKMYALHQAMQAPGEGKFTAPVKALSNRKMYRFPNPCSIE